MKPDISIIVSNYNYGRYLDGALSSILHQTYKNWECIVVDDGSSDDSVDIIKKFVKKDKRFQLIQQEHAGVCVARNKGLDLAQGEYIAFLDADDCYTDYALEMLIHLAQTTGADMVGGAANNVPETFKFMPTDKLVWHAGLNALQKNPAAMLIVPQAHRWCWVWRRIYKRSLIGDVRFNEDFTTFGDDLTFMLDLCWRANVVAETQNAVVYHRVHNQAVTGSRFDEHYFDWFPTYFRYIHDNLLDKYNSRFWGIFYRASFAYMLVEAVFKPKQLNKYQQEGKQVVVQACKFIPRRYLTLKQRILCRFLACLK